MSMPAPVAPSACWNCGQSLQATAERCLWCGVAQRSAAQFVVAPGPTSATTSAAPVAIPVGAAPVPVQPGVPRPAARATLGLGPAFRGGAAGAGGRLLAFTIDVVAVVAVTVGVLLATGGTPVFAAIAALEAIVFLWVLEARTGLTVGNAVLRIRSSRDDAPYSPGVGRAFVRNLITGLGFAILLFGAWIVVASSAWDAGGRRRSWADRAARTVVVAVPPRERGNAPVAPAIAQAGAVTPPVGAAPALAAPQLVGSLARATSPSDDSVSSSHTGAAPAFAAAVPTIAPAPGTPTGTPAPVIESDVAEPTAAEAQQGGALLLIFDTGQREQLPIPGAVNLGRNPVATEPSDHLVSVADPESTVSKTHLRLEYSRGRMWVTDGGSTNGTELLEDDGDVIRLVGGQRTALEEGVRVRIGNRAFTVSVLQSSTPASAEGAP